MAEEVPRTLSDLDTFTHICKAVMGTGLLSLPSAFSNTGLTFGIFATIIMTFVSGHCHYILIMSAQELFGRVGKTHMSFGEVAEESFLQGPDWCKKFSRASGKVVAVSTYIAYFTTCSCYSVIIAAHLEFIIENSGGPDVNVRILLALLILPFVLLEWIPDLKVLAPFSMFANLLMFLGLGITFYYLVQDLPPISSRKQIGRLEDVPTFIAVILFALQCIGVLLTLENRMITPEHFGGPYGILVRAFGCALLVSLVLGFIGYLKYGDFIRGSVVLNLPGHELPAMIANGFIAIAVFFTFAVQFYVCIELAWNGLRDRVKKSPLLVEYILRTVMTVLCILMAVAVPKIIPFVGFIGAFCFSLLGMIVPVSIQMLIYYEKGYGRFNYMIYKNILLLIIAILAMIFGSKNAIDDIIEMYTTLPANETSIASSNATTKAPE